MNWISVITLIISLGTLIIAAGTLFSNIKERKIDRRIGVIIEERRRMQQKLFENVIGILEIDREVQYGKLLKEENILFHEVLNYKVGVWINLNHKNSFSEELRSSCTSLATWAANSLDEKRDINLIFSDRKSTNRNRQNIWVLIEKYIEEEEELIQSIVAGKNKK